MFSNLLTKLINLEVFNCRMDNRTLELVLRILEKSHPNLRGLVIS